MNWFDQLQPASFRNVPFAVLVSNGRFGRRNAVHEYPYRDTIWVEDLGRSARRFVVVGFLVGQDVIAQREMMVAASEGAGDGLLVHPTYGSLRVSVLGFEIEEKWDKGQYFEFRLAFVEAGLRVFPSVFFATSDSVLMAADAADASSLHDFVARASQYLKQGAVVARQAASTAASWSREAQRLSDDATSLKNLVSQMQGNNGRYARGRNSGGFSGSLQNIQGTAMNVNQLINMATISRNNIALSASSLNAIASALSL